MALRKDKPLKINGVDIAYVPKGFKFHEGGGKRETRGQIGGSKTTSLNQEEDFAKFTITLENTVDNIAFMRGVYANDDSNVITYGDTTYNNCVLEMLPEDIQVLETSDYLFHADSIATND
jgi:hypothetical protein